MPYPPLRILYAEDDPDTREMVTLILATEGWDVTATDAHDQVLLLARNGAFDLYLLDSRLPGMSGLDLCKLLRQFDKVNPILFYSGAAFAEDKKRALDSGAQGYLVKPIDPDVLVAEVVRLIKPSLDVKSSSANNSF